MPVISFQTKRKTPLKRKAAGILLKSHCRVTKMWKVVLKAHAEHWLITVLIKTKGEFTASLSMNRIFCTNKGFCWVSHAETRGRQEMFSERGCRTQEHPRHTVTVQTDCPSINRTCSISLVSPSIQINTRAASVTNQSSSSPVSYFYTQFCFISSFFSLSRVRSAERLLSPSWFHTWPPGSAAPFPETSGPRRTPSFSSPSLSCSCWAGWRNMVDFTVWLMS